MPHVAALDSTCCGQTERIPADADPLPSRRSSLRAARGQANGRPDREAWEYHRSRRGHRPCASPPGGHDPGSSGWDALSGGGPHDPGRPRGAWADYAGPRPLAGGAPARIQPGGDQDGRRLMKKGLQIAKGQRHLTPEQKAEALRFALERIRVQLSTELVNEPEAEQIG